MPKTRQIEVHDGAPPSSSSPSRVPETHERGSPVSYTCREAHSSAITSSSPLSNRGDTCRRYRPLADSRSLKIPTPPSAAPQGPVSTVRISFLALCHVPTIGLAPPGFEPSSHWPRLGLPLCPPLAMPGPLSLLCHTVGPAWADLSTSGPTWVCLSDSAPPGHIFPFWPHRCTFLQTVQIFYPTIDFCNIWFVNCSSKVLLCF